MKEREVIDWLGKRVESVGDDCAVIPFKGTHLVFTIDMLWEETDFPKGIKPFTIGWRTIAVSLSDIAAMGAKPLGVVAALGAPQFEQEFLEEVLRGGQACCKAVNADYVGGDLSSHSSLTLTSSAIGEVAKPVMRSGAQIGDLVCVTGQLGRTAAALKLFGQSELEQANQLFQFIPRVNESLMIAPFATSMMDISDGLARSLHQIGSASKVGFEIDPNAIPFVDELKQLAKNQNELLEMGLFTGEDFELLFTLPSSEAQKLTSKLDISVIGEVVSPEAGIKLRGNDGLVELEDRGYEHGAT